MHQTPKTTAIACNRNTAVNIYHIEKIYDLSVFIDNDNTIELSRRRKKYLTDKMDKRIFVVK